MDILRSAPLRKKLDWFPDEFDHGVYDDTASRGQTVSMWLEEKRAEKRGEESPYVGLTKAQVIAKKKEYKARGQEPPLTAFEECLKAAGIKAFGAYTDVVQKFFEYSDANVLFPEFVADRIYAGMLADSLVPEFAAMETVLDAPTFHKVYIEDSESARSLARVAVGEEFPETMILVSKQSIQLSKFGRYLTVSYEDLKFQRLNVFGEILKRIGKQIDIDRTDRLFATLISGDGEAGPAAIEKPATSGSIVTGDVIEWATVLPSPYKMDKFVGQKEALRLWYTALAGFQNPVATWGFMGINLPKAYEWDRNSIPDDYLVGVDSRYAIEHVTTGAVLTETEKLIRRQIQGTAVSHRDAFAIIDTNARYVYDTTYSG